MFNKLFSILLHSFLKELKDNEENFRIHHPAQDTILTFELITMKSKNRS